MCLMFTINPFYSSVSVVEQVITGGAISSNKLCFTCGERRMTDLI